MKKKYDIFYGFNEHFYYYQPYENEFLTLQHAGITYEDPSYYIRRGNNNVLFVFEYVVSGEGYINYNGERQKIKGGDSYIISPHIEHEYYSNPKNPWRKIWINCNGTLVESLANVYNVNGFNHLVGFSLQSDITDIHNLLQSKPQDMLYQLQISILKLFLKVNKFITTKINTNANAVVLKNYIDENFNQPISLADLAKLIDKSESNISRIFKDNWGMSPYNYIQKRRLGFAKKYLQNTSMSIKEIAQLLSFSDEFYFSNWFKKQENISPRNYRDEYLNKIMKKIP